MEMMFCICHKQQLIKTEESSVRLPYVIHVQILCHARRQGMLSHSPTRDGGGGGGGGGATGKLLNFHRY